MGIKAIFFDLDGVLVNCADLHYEALNRALRDSFFGGISREEHLRVFNGLPTKAKLHLLAQQGRIDRHKMEDVAILKQQYTLDLAKTQVRPDPVKVEMCRELAANYFLGCVSNCVRASVELLLYGAGLRQYFNLCVSNQDVVCPKPDPEPYRMAFKALVEKVVPAPGKAEVLVIEDNDKGVQSAQAAGLEVVQLQYPYITLGIMRAVIAAAERKLS